MTGMEKIFCAFDPAGWKTTLHTKGASTDSQKACLHTAAISHSEEGGYAQNHSDRPDAEQQAARNVLYKTPAAPFREQTNRAQMIVHI